MLQNSAAANLSVGFITEAGQAVNNYITTGASTIFPQGTYRIFGRIEQLQEAGSPLNSSAMPWFANLNSFDHHPIFDLFWASTDRQASPFALYKNLQSYDTTIFRAHSLREAVLNSPCRSIWHYFLTGLVHYQQNLDCNPAYYTISYNNEDPGTQVILHSGFDSAYLE